MAEILIHGMEMPKNREHITVVINADGTVQELMDVYCKVIAKATEIPPHGELISKDATIDAILDEPDEESYPTVFAQIVNEMPVIVPASK